LEGEIGILLYERDLDLFVDYISKIEKKKEKIVSELKKYDEYVPSLLRSLGRKELRFVSYSEEDLDWLEKKMEEAEAIICIGSGGKKIYEKYFTEISTPVYYIPIKRVRSRNGKTLYFFDRVAEKRYEGNVYDASNNEIIVENKKIILLDDFLNSGSTAKEVAKWIGKNNCIKAICTLARKIKPGNYNFNCISIFSVDERNESICYLADDLLKDFKEWEKRGILD